MVSSRLSISNQSTRSLVRRFLFTLALAHGACLLLLHGAASALSSPFQDGFDLDLVIEEAGSMAESASADWWLSSGGRFLSTGGLGMTLQGSLPDLDPWRLAYAASNPGDTDDGYHPQNIFRLVTRCQWKDFDQGMYFRLRGVNLSESPSRAGHNGVLFFHRYLDGNNVYYAGLRVDGAAVVKKKLAGVYTTLAYKQVYPGTYDRVLNPNLIPQDRWIGMRTVTRDQPDGSVALRLEINDAPMTGGWVTVLQAVDASSTAIHSTGYAGIRTDFMDVEFDDYYAGDDCATSISPASESFGAAGGTGTVAVAAPVGCPWSAASNVSWIAVTSGASGSGSGTVTYSVAPNPSAAALSGTLTIAGQTFIVNQEGLPCIYALSPLGQSFGAAGGTGTVAVTAPAGCPWSAASNVSWIAVTSGASGSGSGTVTYQVAPNPKRRSRTGTLTIAGQSFQVTEMRP